MIKAASLSTLPLVLLLTLCFLILTSCSSVYYEALESVGIEKRQILVDRIDDTRDAQEEAKEQFTTALERYRSVVKVEGGDLEEIYDRLNADYERSVMRADEVRNRIDAVEPVNELAAIEQATDQLIREMEGSIAEAGRFIDSMK